MMKAHRSTLVGGLLTAAGLVGAAILATSHASAQVVASGGFFDFSGEYQPQFTEDQLERVPGPEIGDYLGMPINTADRAHGDAWSASLLTLPEHQCKPHPSDYGMRGPANLRIWTTVETSTQRLIAYHTHISWQAPERTIWMDGRPHPPEYAAHTWQGFSTGAFVGDSLTITTDHLKMGWVRRNGLYRSDQATVIEHWNKHGKYFTWMEWINDPVFLTEPFVRTTDFVENPNQQIAPYPCEAVIEVDKPLGDVPHHLPGTNPFLQEFSRRWGVPYEATRGGAETMYPEYMAKVKAMPKPEPLTK